MCLYVLMLSLHVVYMHTGCSIIEYSPQLHAQDLVVFELVVVNTPAAELLAYKIRHKLRRYCLLCPSFFTVCKMASKGAL